MLYGDLLKSEREIHDVTDEWSDSLGTDISPPRVLALLTGKLLARHEMRYLRNLKMLRHIDKSARNSLNAEEFLSFVKGRISVLPTQAEQKDRNYNRVEREARLQQIAEIQFEIAKERKGVGEAGLELTEGQRWVQPPTACHRSGAVPDANCLPWPPICRRRATLVRVPLEELAMATTALELAEIEERKMDLASGYWT